GFHGSGHSGRGFHQVDRFFIFRFAKVEWQRRSGEPYRAGGRNLLGPVQMTQRYIMQMNGKGGRGYAVFKNSVCQAFTSAKDPSKYHGMAHENIDRIIIHFSTEMLDQLLSAKCIVL